MKTPILLLASLFMCTFAWTDPLPITQTGDTLQIKLSGALRSSNQNRMLMLEFQRWNGRWFTGTGYSPSYNKGSHQAILLDMLAEVPNRIDILAHIDGDAWVGGGPAQYRIQWEPQSDGTFAGTFTGSFRGGEVTGIATGAFHPAAPALPAFTPASRGEHPRLLFKKRDLPALRQKAETAFGKRALETFPRSAVGLGVLYQL